MARFYASEITSAIAHMHALGFVHRDIKASNVVLCGAGHAKLVDLGCAKQLEHREEGGCDDGDGGSGSGSGLCDDSGGGGASWERTHTYCGTPHCMAPEMVSREGHTWAVDWW